MDPEKRLGQDESSCLRLNDGGGLKAVAEDLNISRKTKVLF
jgi:hypothetical protein